MKYKSKDCILKKMTGVTNVQIQLRFKPIVVQKLCLLKFLGSDHYYNQGHSIVQVKKLLVCKELFVVVLKVIYSEEIFSSVFYQLLLKHICNICSP